MPVDARAYPELVAALERYAGLGWKIFPCHGMHPEGDDEYCGDMVCLCKDGKGCSQPGKRPCFTGYYDDATDNLGRIMSTWFKGGFQDTRPLAKAPYNVGVITGRASGFIVYDMDPKNGGEASHAANVAAYGWPLTVAARSGSGVGRHFFFKWDPRLDVIKARMYTPWPGIDIFCGGTSLVILPPSRHKSGNYYEWLPGTGPDELEMAPCPEWIVQTLHAEHERAMKHSATSASRSIGGLNTAFEQDLGAAAVVQAFQEYIAANTPQWPADNSRCPMCGSDTGFKISKMSGDRWICHGGHHHDAKVGTIATNGAWTGDVVDLHAFEEGIYDPENRRASRVKYLKRQGYL